MRTKIVDALSAEDRDSIERISDNFKAGVLEETATRSV
jgi:hypothetical protein